MACTVMPALNRRRGGGADEATFLQAAGGAGAALCKATSMVPCCRGGEHATSRRGRTRIIVIPTVEVEVAVSVVPRRCRCARKHSRGREYQKSKFPCHDRGSSALTSEDIIDQSAGSSNAAAKCEMRPAWPGPYPARVPGAETSARGEDFAFDPKETLMPRFDRPLRSRARPRWFSLPSAAPLRCAGSAAPARKSPRRRGRRRC